MANPGGQTTGTTRMDTQDGAPDEPRMDTNGHGSAGEKTGRASGNRRCKWLRLNVLKLTRGCFCPEISGFAFVAEPKTTNGDQWTRIQGGERNIFVLA